MDSLHHAPAALDWAVSLGLPLTLMLAGLVGGATHCAGMCGPFVLAQVGARLDRTGAAPYGEVRRLAGAALVPYHLGRATTYALLGAAAGSLAGGAATLPFMGWLPSAMLALAGLVLLSQAVARGARLLPRRAGAGPGRLSTAVARLSAPLLADPRGWRGYALGVVLGFLPCGLLWGALAAAGGAGGAAAGALAMAAFALGTVPALVGVGYAGALFGRRFRPALAWATPAILLLNAVTLGALAVRALA
jgi:sulfite exporter TauE/SafE